MFIPHIRTSSSGLKQVEELFSLGFPEDFFNSLHQQGFIPAGLKGMESGPIQQWQIL
jgi:hypothetical protein